MRASGHDARRVNKSAGAGAGEGDRGWGGGESSGVVVVGVRALTRRRGVLRASAVGRAGARGLRGWEESRQGG